MTSRNEKVERFRNLHVPKDPILLYNIWDAGSAATVARAGAKAIATSSWSVAAAQGYEDGEVLPLEGALAVAASIVARVDLPVTVDFEGGYASDPQTVAQNVGRLLSLGVVGLNFEDRVVDGRGLHGVEEQAARLRAIRRAADAAGVRAFVNARTDVFLAAEPGVDPASLLDEALAREAAYAAAGADGFFVPGLTDADLIGRLCEAAGLPINVMITTDLERARDLAARGVARISFGPAPYIGAMERLRQEAAALI